MKESNEPVYVHGLASSIFKNMRNSIQRYDKNLLEEALTANVSRKDFDGARAILSISKAERIYDTTS
jgi:hypothetical protein